MKARVTAGDRVVELTLADNATEADLRRATAEFDKSIVNPGGTGGVGGEWEENDEKFGLETLKRNAVEAAKGVGRVAGGVLTGPAIVADAAKTFALGSPDQPSVGRSFTQAVANTLGTPEGYLERALAELPIGLGIAGLMAKAGQVAGGTSMLANVLRATYDDLVRMGPEKFALLETALSVSGSVGSEAGAELAKGTDMETPFEIVGGLIGSLGFELASRFVMSAARTVGRRVGVGAEGHVREALQTTNRGKPITDIRLQKAQDIEETLPGLQFTTSQATEDPTIREVFRHIEESDAPTARAVETLNQKNERRLVRELEENIASPTGDVDTDLQLVAQATRERLEGLDAQFDTAIASAENQLLKRLEDYKELPATAATSDRLQQAVAVIEDKFDAVKGLPFEEVDQSFRVRAEPVIDIIADQTHPSVLEEFQPKLDSRIKDIPEGISQEARDAILASINSDTTARKLSTSIDAVDDPSTPGVFARTLALNGVTDGFSLRRLQIIRRSLLEESRRLRRSTEEGAATRLRRVVLARKELDNFLDNLEPEDVFGVPVEQVATELEKLKQARAEYGAGIDALKVGVIGRLIQPGQHGADFAKSARLFPDEILRDQQAAREFKQLATTFGELAPEELAAAKSALYDHAKRSLVEVIQDPNTGVITSNNGRAWLKQRGAGLREFPDLYQELRKVVRARSELKQVVANASADRRGYERGVLQLFTKHDPDKALRKTLSGPSPVKAMRVLRATLKNNTDALQGLRAATSNIIMEEAFNTRGTVIPGWGINPTAWAAGLDKHEKALRVLYSGKEFAAITRVARAAEHFSMWLRSSSPGLNTRLTQKEMDDSHGFYRLVSGVWAWARTIAGPEWVAGTLAAEKAIITINNLNAKEQLNLVHRLAFDPKAAEALLSVSSHSTAGRSWNLLGAALLGPSVDPAGKVVRDWVREKREGRPTPSARPIPGPSPSPQPTPPRLG